MQVLWKNLLAQAVEQEGALAVECAAAGGLHKGAQQAGGQRRFEQHRAFGGRDFAGMQAAERPVGCVDADGLRAGQFVGTTLRAEPGVALHLVACAGNGGDRQAVV